MNHIDEIFLDLSLYLNVMKLFVDIGVCFFLLFFNNGKIN